MQVLSFTKLLSKSPLAIDVLSNCSSRLTMDYLAPELTYSYLSEQRPLVFAKEFIYEYDEEILNFSVFANESTVRFTVLYLRAFFL